MKSSDCYTHNIHVEASISNSHILSSHGGKCNNLHGHNYDVVVDISVPEKIYKVISQQDGMIIDFGTVKRIVNQYDHCFVFDFNSPVEMEFAQLVAKHNMRSMDLGMATTAENFSKRLAQDILTELKLSFLTQIKEAYSSDAFDDEYAIIKVSCAETKNNVAVTTLSSNFKLD